MPPYLHSLSLKTNDDHGDKAIGGPCEFLLQTKLVGEGSPRIQIQGYKDVDGAAESRGIFIGDHLIFINGHPVGTGMKLRPDGPKFSLRQAQAMLDDTASYPICLTFARPRSRLKSSDFDVESEHTKNMSVVASSKDELGFVFGKGSRDDHFIVKKFHAVQGSLQRVISDSLGSQKCNGLTFHSIHGERVPSYANCDMVMNAIKRAWAKSSELELVLCNEEIKKQICDLA